MIKSKYILSGFLLLAMIIFLSGAQCIAVVPYPISTAAKPGTSTKEERLSEIIEKIEAYEKANIEFFYEIKNELKQILKK